MTFYRWKGLPPHTALSLGNCSLPATTLSYLSSRPQGRDLQCALRSTHIYRSSPLSFLSSCLPRRAVGAKRLADLSHNEGLIARSRRTSAMLLGRCCSELSGHKHKKSQPLSARHPSRAWLPRPETQYELTAAVGAQCGMRLHGAPVARTSLWTFCVPLTAPHSPCNR